MVHAAKSKSLSPCWIGGEAINGNWNVGGWADPGDPYDGDGAAWRRIKSLRGDYERIQEHLDVPHYIDYMLMFMFGHSEAEYRCVGPVGRGSGFKFFLNDADVWLRTSADDRTVRHCQQAVHIHPVGPVTAISEGA